MFMWAERQFIVFICVSIHFSVCRMPANLCFVLTVSQLLWCMCWCVLPQFFLTQKKSQNQQKDLAPESPKHSTTWITVAILDIIHASKPDFAEGLCLLLTLFTYFVFCRQFLFSWHPRTVGTWHLCSWQLTMATVKWCAFSWRPEPGVRPSPCERPRRMGMRKWWGCCWKQVGYLCDLVSSKIPSGND